MLTCRHTKIIATKHHAKLDTHMHKNEKIRRKKTDKLLERRRRKQCESRDCVTLMLASETEEESREKRQREKKTQVDPFQQIMFSSK